MGINIWEEADKVVKPKSTNIWDEAASVTNEPQSFSERYALELEREKEERERAINRVKNLGKIAISGIGALMGHEASKNVWATLKAGQQASKQGNKLAGQDIAKAFSAVDLSDTISDMWSGAVDRVKNRKAETLNALVDMPMAIASSFIGDTFRAVSGVDISGNEIRALTPEEHARSTKMFIGNAVATVVAPGVSKGVEAAFAARTAAQAGVPRAVMGNVAGATLEQATRLSNAAPPLGAIGRAIIDDTVAGATSGVAQGVIANANTEETLGAAAMGFFFAPIGVLTGMYRGLKNPVGGIEDAITKATDVRMLRQAQEIQGLSTNEIAAKFSTILGSDTIEQALGHIERVEAAAWAVGDTIIPGGGTHSEIAQALSSYGKKNIYDMGEYDDYLATASQEVKDAIAKGDAQPGFITSHGRFVGFEEAGELAMKYAPDKIKDRLMKKSVDGKPWMDSLDIDDIHAAEKKLGIYGKKGWQPSTLDDLYNDFKTTLDDKRSWTTSLVEYVENKKLQPYFNEILDKFSTKYKDEIVDPEVKMALEDLIAQHKKTQDAKVGDLYDISPEEFVSKSIERGFYVTNEYGVLKIRDIESGESMASATSLKEAAKLMDTMGTPPNPIDMALSTDVPVNGIQFPPGMIPAPGASPLFTDYKIVNEKFGIRNSSFARWDTSTLSQITAMFPWAEGVDLRFGPFTMKDGGQFSLKQHVLNVMDRGARLTKIAIDREMRVGELARLEKLRKDFKITPDEMQTLRLYIETKSREELLAPGGHNLTKTVSQEAVQLADNSFAAGVDFSKALLYRRQLKALHLQAMRKAAELASLNKQKNMTIGSISKSEIDDIFHAEIDRYQEMPEFQEALSQLDTQFGADQNFKSIVDQIDQTFNSPDGEGSFYVQAAARLRAGMDNPDKLGLTRKDFAAKYNLRPEAIKFAEEAEKAFSKYGTEFGIQDWRKINGYVQHYRTYIDPNDVSIARDFSEDFGLLEGEKQFVSALSRVGEVEFFQTDLFLNLQAYVRAGYKAKHLYPTITEAKEALKQILPQIRRQDDKFADAVATRFEDYTRDISGQPSKIDELAQNALVHQVVQIAREEGRKLSYDELARAASSPDHIDTMMNLSSAAALGGRLSMALRDTYDVFQKMFIKYDFNTVNELRKVKVPKKVIDDLVEKGEILRPDPIDFYNVAHSQRIRGWESRASRTMADWGFKTSAQGYVYMRNQAAVYNWTLENSAKNLQALRAGKLTRDEFISKISLRKYDPGTQRKVIMAIDSQWSDYEVAKILARENTRDMVGAIMRGNQPPVMHSRIGKLFGQLGSWGMTNRSVMQNLLTRGTRQEQMNAWAKYALSLAGTAATGRVLGVNLGRWALLPTSFVATGGPILNTIEALGSAASAELGGNENQTRYTRRELARGLEMLIPFSQAASDVNKAIELHTQGSGFGMVRTTAQAIGIGVNTSDRTFYDWVVGNPPPFKWTR